MSKVRYDHKVFVSLKPDRFYDIFASFSIECKDCKGMITRLDKTQEPTAANTSSVSIPIKCSNCDTVYGLLINLVN